MRVLRRLLRTVPGQRLALPLAVFCAAAWLWGGANGLRPERGTAAPQPLAWSAPKTGAARTGSAILLQSSDLFGGQRRPLDVVADASNRGYRIALPVAWCVLALDVLLILFALAVPRHRGVVGRAVQRSAWLFGATAWMMGAVICLFLGGWRWFAGGVLLAGVGVIPVGIYVGVLARPGGGLVESLIAMALATVAAWYAGRRLRRTAAPPALAPRAGADAR